MKIKIKQILLAPLCAVVVIAGVATFAAFEAHVINVTAHIENALAVSPDTADGIQFGTVFPQEYLENEELIIKLSPSFINTDQIRVNTVDYKIVQKPKPTGDAETTLTANAAIDVTTITVVSTTGMAEDDEIVIGYHNNMERKVILSIDTTNLIITLTTALTKVHASGETVIEVYPDLCRFLSKLPQEGDGDIGVPSYLTRDADNKPESCALPFEHELLEATGQLINSTDISDEWIIDLNVPPVDGSIGQDWPDTCADWTVPEETDYGCDLWIEVTGITKVTY